jgi:hypothetical protein
VGLTPASAMAQVGQFKKPVPAKSEKLRSRIQPATKQSPGDALICLAIPTKSNLRPLLLIETVTAEGAQRCWVYTLSQQQEVFHDRVQEIPVTEKLQDLQDYELTTQPITLAHSVALQHCLEEREDKSLAAEHIRSDSSIDGKLGTMNSWRRQRHSILQRQ